MKKVSMIIMTLFLLVGMTASAYAKAAMQVPLPPPNNLLTVSINDPKNFLLISSNIFSSYYLDNSRIVKYANSRLLDAWVKRVNSEKGKGMEIQLTKNASKLNNKNPEMPRRRENSKETKAKLELIKKTSYQLIHQQFDPINFKYKTLEVYSYGVNSQLLSSSKNPLPWATIPVESVEDKTLTCINDYMQNNLEKVTFK